MLLRDLRSCRDTAYTRLVALKLITREATYFYPSLSSPNNSTKRLFRTGRLIRMTSTQAEAALHGRPLEQLKTPRIETITDRAILVDDEPEGSDGVAGQSKKGGRFRSEPEAASSSH